jgi:hypothetical protein
MIKEIKSKKTIKKKIKYIHNKYNLFIDLNNTIYILLIHKKNNKEKMREIAQSTETKKILFFF